jgi:cell division protein FtsA
LLANLKELASKFFDVKVSIGVPRYEGEFADIVCNPKFSTAIGALYFANEFMLYNKYADEFKFVAEHNSTLSKIKNFFKNM